MTTRISRLAILCAAVVATLAAPARALTIAVDGAPEVVLRFAGSSGMSKSFAAVVNAQLCQAGTNTVYWDDRPPVALGAEDGRLYQAYYCRAKAGITGVTPGARLLVVKRDRDGALLGVAPVVNKQAIEFMRVDNTCTDLGAAATYPNPRFLCSGLESAAPDGGLTDVERSVWGARGQFTQSVPGDVNEIKGLFGQGFGIGVSNALYSALQAAQGLTVGATDAANQPRLTRTQYAAIVSTVGNYVNASNLTGVPGKLFSCRRTNTSGTQAASDIFFLDNPCKKLASPLFGMLQPRGAGTYANLTVIENSTTADQIGCLQDADPATVGQEQAIGVVSLENVPNVGWRFIKLDGVSPNFYATDPDGAGVLKRGDPDATQRRNVILGHYLFAFEGTVLWRKDNLLSGALQLVADGFSSPSLVNLTGIYSVWKPTNGATNAAFPDRVSKGSRFGNSCLNQMLFE